MENLSDSDANILQTFGPGQGIVSGQAVRFPLLVKVKFDADLVSDAIGDEDFIAEAGSWAPAPVRTANTATVKRHMPVSPAPPDTKLKSKSDKRGESSPKKRMKPPGRRGRIWPEGF